MTPSILFLGGPTASGKNQIAFEIAQRYPCEIVNADSRQIYHGLEIGTNQPSELELSAVAHHLFGFLDPSVRFSAADYERMAFPLVQKILARKHFPVVVGGTGFYMKALLKGVWPVPARNETLRERMKTLSSRKGNPYLYRILERLDPESARKVAPNDQYRIIRSLEIFFTTGKRKSSLVDPDIKDRIPAFKFYLAPERSVLLESIRKRTDQMFESGWVEEVKKLLKKYPRFVNLPASQSLGYQQIIRLIQGEINESDCKAEINHKTGQYAKRQLTWFRNQDQFVPMPPREQLLNLLESVLQ